MRGIQIAVELHRPGAPPESFPFVGEFDPAQIMKVAALGMKNLAEDPLPHHVVDHHFHAVVVAVLHEHAVLVVLLGRLDDRPAILHGHRRRDFGGRVLPVFHRRQHDRHVKLPGRRVEDEIEVFAFAEALEVARPAGVDRGRRLAGVGDGLGRPVGAFRPDVAHGGNAAAGDLEQVANVPGALPADADEPDADGVDGSRREAGCGSRLRRRRAGG